MLIEGILGRSFARSMVGLVIACYEAVVVVLVMNIHSLWEICTCWWSSKLIYWNASVEFCNCLDIFMEENPNECRTMGDIFDNCMGNLMLKVMLMRKHMAHGFGLKKLVIIMMNLVMVHRATLKLVLLGDGGLPFELILLCH